MSLDLAVIKHHDIRRRLESFYHIMRDIEGRNIPLCEPRRQWLKNGNLEIRIHAW